MTAPPSPRDRSRGHRYAGSKTPISSAARAPTSTTSRSTGMLRARVRALADGARRDHRRSTSPRRATMPGVVAVYTADDIDVPRLRRRSMQLHPAVARPPSATDRVRFVGDIVAVVVAETHGAGGRRRRDGGRRLRAARLRRSTWKTRSPPTRRCSSRRSAPTSSIGDARRRTTDAARRRRRRRARPLREPARRRRADGGRGDRGRARRRRRRSRAHRASRVPDAAHRSAACSPSSLGIDPERVRVDRTARRRIVRRQAPGSAEGIDRGELARELGRPVKWVETRSENMIAMGHGRGQVQYVELGLAARRHHRRDAVPRHRRRRRVRAASAACSLFGHDADRWRRACTTSRRSASTSRSSTTNTTPMGAYRGAGRPEAAAFLERIIDMAADELGIDPVELRRKNFIGPERVPVHDRRPAPTTTVGEYRRRSTRRCGSPATTACVPSKPHVASAATRCSSASACRATSRSPGGGARVRRGRGARRRHGHGQGGHVVARSGSRDRVLADRRPISSACRIDRIRFVQSDTALVPRGGGTGGLAFAAARRHRGARGVEAGARPRRSARRGAARGGARGHRRHRRRPLGVAGVPRRRSRGPSVVDQGAATTGTPLAVEHDFEQCDADVPVRRAHVGGRGRHRDRRGRAASATSRSTTAGASSTRCSSTASSTAASRRASPRRCGRRCVYDDDGNPLTSTLAEYAIPSAAEFPPLRGGAHRDADAAQPARRQGHRRVGARSARTPAVQNAVVDALEPPRRAPHRHAVHARARVAGDRGRQAGTPPDPWREPPAAFATLPVRSARPSNRPRRSTEHRPLIARGARSACSGVRRAKVDRVRSQTHEDRRLCEARPGGTLRMRPIRAHSTAPDRGS